MTEIKNENNIMTYSIILRFVMDILTLQQMILYNLKNKKLLKITQWLRN